MINTAVLRQVAVALEGRPGWDRPAPYHFRHAGTGVHILVYARDLTVVFGRDPGIRHDKAVSARTAFFPTVAVEAVLEVAFALVTTRERAETAG